MVEARWCRVCVARAMLPQTPEKPAAAATSFRRCARAGRESAGGAATVDRYQRECGWYANGGGRVADHRNFRNGVRLSGQDAGLDGRPVECELLGMRWHLLSGVFSPARTASTELFSRWLPYPEGGSFLEVGCGAGVTAVWAARQGCRRVTAVDIEPAAVRNTAANVARHDVTGVVRVLRSDVFAGLDSAGGGFDVVFWNSQVIPAPPDVEYSNSAQWVIFDRGYAAHRRYLAQGPKWLNPNGRLFLGFNSMGDRSRLRAVAAELGHDLVERAAARRVVGDVAVTFQLLEVLPLTGGASATSTDASTDASANTSAGAGS